MNFGNKLSDIKEPALEHSAPVVTPPLTITKHSALAQKPHHRDSFACLTSPLKSLPAEQISQRSSSYGIFACGKSAEAAKLPEMHSEKVSCFNPHCPFGVDGNAKRPTDYERAASLTQDTQLAIEDDMLHLKRQQSNTWIAHLKELWNDEEQFCRRSHISLDMLTF